MNPKRDLLHRKTLWQSWVSKRVLSPLKPLKFLCHPHKRIISNLNLKTPKDVSSKRILPMAVVNPHFPKSPCFPYLLLKSCISSQRLHSLQTLIAVVSQSSHISFISLFLSPCHAHPSLHMETVYIWQLCISSKSLSKSSILIFFHVATMSSTHSSLKRLSFSFLNIYAPRKSSFHLKPPMLCLSKSPSNLVAFLILS